MEKIEDLKDKKEQYLKFFEWLFDDEEILDKTIDLSEEIDLSLCSTYEDPNIYYPEQIKKFFDTKAMKRLSRISQLGLASNTFSNLYHTRLEHSKGVYNRKVEELFYNFQNSDWKKYIEENNLKQYLIAELIKVAGHDIGHFPFSHAFEEQVIEKRGFHEEIGKKLMLEDEEITKVINSISPSLHSILEELYSKNIMNFKSHDESSYDNDRLDYLQRDNLYAGYRDTLPSQKYTTVKVKSDKNNLPIVNQDSSISESNDGNLFIDVYDYSSLPEILKALHMRQKQYKEIYMGQLTSMSESSISNFLKAFLKSNSNVGKELQEYLLYFKNNSSNSQNINLEFFKEFDEILFYFNLLEIAEKHEDKNIRDLATMIIPKFSEFLKLINSFLDFKKNPTNLSASDKALLLKIKSIIQNNSELSNKLENPNFINNNVLVLPEKFNVRNSGLQDLITTFSFKTASYKKKEPIYIRNSDGKIYELSSLPGLEEDILKKDKIYFRFLNIPFLRFNGISENTINKLRFRFFFIPFLRSNGISEHIINKLKFRFFKKTEKDFKHPECNMSPVQSHHNLKANFTNLEIE